MRTNFKAWTIDQNASPLELMVMHTVQYKEQGSVFSVEILAEDPYDAIERVQAAA